MTQLCIWGSINPGEGSGTGQSIYCLELEEPTPPILGLPKNIMSLGVAVLKDDLQSDHAHLVLPKPSTQKHNCW